MRRPLATLLALLLAAGPALATWSIVVVNLETGEVCVASATCIEGMNLRGLTPVLIPEIGGAAAQAAGDNIGTRILMHDDFIMGESPEAILSHLDNFDSLHQHRQYGMVDTQGRALTFTGSQAFDWAGGVTGQSGSLVYAIQGNILTGAPVVLEAEQALLNTPGDLSQKVMAAMEAAAAFGGDGRCSCDTGSPTSCGSPPPGNFKSSHIAYYLIARPGDQAGICNMSGCAKGDFWLTINERDLSSWDPDPIILMRQDYDAWRLDLAGRPDAVLSTVHAPTHHVEAGSPSTVAYLLELADIDGVALTTGGAAISMVHDSRSSGSSTLVNVIDNLDGTYVAEIAPGVETGLDRLRFVVDDGVKPVTLWPPVSLLLHPANLEPWNDPQPIPGLSGLNSSHPFLMPNGLTAFALSTQPSGSGLFRATRASTVSPFGAGIPVSFTAFDPARIRDFWISADELRITFSFQDPLAGVERLAFSSRTSIADDFSSPEILDELDSGTGDQSPWLSPDELEMVFASSRFGSPSLFLTRRLNSEARWFPPTRLDLPSSSAGEPVFTDGGIHIFHGRPGNGPHFAFRTPDGLFQPAGAAPGGLHPSQGTLLPASREANQQVLWFTGAAGGSTEVFQASRRPDTLMASIDILSAAAGGTVSFLLDAGPDWAGQPYILVAGGSGIQPGTQHLDTVLPLVADSVTGMCLSLANGPVLPGASGQLDGLGQASAALVMPPGLVSRPSLLDRDYHFAFLAMNGQNGFASQPALVYLAP